MKVSIVLPTRNAGTRFDYLLDALRSQETPDPVEILAVDSGSTDGTLERLRDHKIRCLQIEPGEFDHGATRDRGIQESNGDIVVLLVQDAVPVGPDWLAELIRPFEDSSVAGSYCRQVARKDCRVVEARRLAESPIGSDHSRLQRTPDSTALEELPPMEQLALCTFDNVASALRRSAWSDQPFGNCAFGEDIQWGRRIIQSGQAIAYVGSCHVEHSHQRSLRYEYRRTYLAHHLLHRLFGLRTVPTHSVAWSSLTHSGPWVRQSLAEERGLLRKLWLAGRAPIERYVTALGQLHGARDALAQRDAPRWRSV